MMTSTIRKFGVGVASVALVASAAVPAFAANDRQSQEVPGPLDGMVKLGRIGGFDRIETAIKIAEKAFADMGGDVEVAYIAGSSDASAVDSAAAGHLSDGPLYLVAGDNRSQEAVAKSITDHYPNVQKIVAIGGTAVVSDATLKGIADKTFVTATARVAGKDRYETAAAIAEYGSTNKGTSEGNQFFSNDLNAKDKNGVPEGSKVYLARGDNPVDALVSGVLKDAPVLLLGPDGTVPEATAAYLKKHLPTQFVALGGDKAVPTSAFLKADFDPVMKNVWLNNEEVQKAEAALNVAKQKLDGVITGKDVNGNPIYGKGINPNNLDPNAKGASAAEAIAINALIADTNAKIQEYQGELDSALATAVSAKKTALALADYHYNGGGLANSSSDRDDVSKNYAGSKKLAAQAGEALETAKTNKAYVDKAVAEIDAAVAVFGASQKQAADAAKMVTDGKLATYITKFGAATKTPEELKTDTAEAGKFATAWAALKLTGFTADESTDPTADSGSNVYSPTVDMKTAKADMDVTAKQSAFDTAKEQASTDKTALDEAQKAYDEAEADAKKNNDDVKTAQGKLNAAQAQLAALRVQLNGKGEPFMGYRKVEQRYSSINGVYNNGLRSLRASIDSELSEAINAESASPEKLWKFNKLPELVKDAYGITLTSGNVREYFAFKKSSVSGQLQVVRANHTRMAEGQYGTYEELSTNDMVAQATSMIDTFYNLMGRGFNTGEMESFFASGGGYTTGVDGFTTLYDGQTTAYKDLAPKKKMLVDAAAKAVIDALITGASKTTNYWSGAPETARIQINSSFTINPYGYIGAVRVSDYLDGIAKRNRKTAEEDLAKAQVAYQAAIDKISPKRYFRIEGSDRYNTSAAIAGYWRAKYLGLDNEKKAKKADVYIANGISYIDAVAGGQLKGGPIVLVAPDGTMTDAVKQRFAFAASDNPVVNVYALGGTKAVPEQALTTAKSAAADKSLLGKNFFSEATNKAVDNADKKADEKK